MLLKKERNRLYSKKHRALYNFFLKNNQLYRKAKKVYSERVIAIIYNTAYYIIYIYEAIRHPSIYKIYQKLLKEIYSVAQKNIIKLLKNYKIYKIN